MKEWKLCYNQSVYVCIYGWLCVALVWCKGTTSIQHRMMATTINREASLMVEIYAS